MWKVALLLTMIVSALSHDCKTRQFLNSSSGTCTDCPAGKISNSTDCVECPPGKYNSGRLDKCEECSLNTFSNRSGSSICEPCPSGTISLFNIKIQCFCDDQTGRGLYSSDDRVCKICSPGKFAIWGYCASCPFQTYSADYGATNCEFCLGEVDQTRSRCDVILENCTAGSVRHTSRNVCVCDSGFYLKDDACIACDAGTYSLVDSKFCVACDEGYWSDPHQSSCQPCSSPPQSSVYYDLQCDLQSDFVHTFGFVCGAIIVGLAFYGLAVRYLKGKYDAWSSRRQSAQVNH